MTTWSKTPPSEPGWYWCRLDGFGLWPVHVRDDRSVAPNVQDWPGGDAAEYGPRIHPPEAVEAAKDALREASETATRMIAMFDGPKAAHRRAREDFGELLNASRAALAKLEGR